ncbi:MAG: cytidylate kinase family protein [Acidobacteriaceae bacterium]
MAVITISEGSFSGGRMLAEAVSRRLGYQCIDREQVIAKAAQWGVSEQELHKTMEKPPSFFGQSPQTKYRYLAFIQAALTEQVRSGNAIYHGLAAHLLLGKGQHVLRVRIIAPLAFRVAMLELRQGLSRKEAVAYIERVDEERRKWTRFLYGVDWTDPAIYDVVLNLEQMTLVDASDVICALIASACFQTTPETYADLHNLALASSVKAHLAMNSETSNLQFEVAAENGSVSIKGEIDSPDQGKRVQSFVKTIAGVRAVALNELSLVTRI